MEKKQYDDWIKKEKRTETKPSLIAIPRKLIFDNNVNVKSKYLYIILKKHSCDDEITISVKKLLDHLRWNDKRTLRKYLLILLENNYIQNISKEEIKTLKILNTLKITLPFEKPFIQLDRKLINHIFNIEKHKHERGLIYLYLQENYYNGKSNEYGWGYSCPMYSDITKIVKLNNKDLKKLIWLYHVNYICEYHKMKYDKENNERYRNRYIVNTLDLINGKYRRRYKKHKKTEYFE